MADTKLNREELLPPVNADYATKAYWETRYDKHVCNSKKVCFSDFFVALQRQRCIRLVPTLFQIQGAALLFDSSAQNPQALQDLLRQYIFENNKVLHVGCGNSTFGEEMFDDFGGNIDIINMDYVPNVIETMKARNKDTRPNLKCMLMLSSFAWLVI